MEWARLDRECVPDAPAVDQCRCGTRSAGFSLLLSLRSRALLAKRTRATETECARNSVRRCAGRLGFSHLNCCRSSDTVASNSGEFELPAIGDFRTPSDAQGPALVVVRRRGRFAGRRDRLSRTQCACRISRRRLAVANLALVADGLP